MLAVPGPGEGEGCCGDAWGEAVGEVPGLGLAAGLEPGLGLATGTGEAPTGSDPLKVTISVSLEHPAKTRSVNNSNKILIREN